MAAYEMDDLAPRRAPAGGRGGFDSDREVGKIRRSLMDGEGKVKSIGLLYLLFAFATGLRAVGSLFFATQAGGSPNGSGVYFFELGLFLTILLVVIGSGIRNLQPWARWIGIGYSGLFIVHQVRQLFLAFVGRPESSGTANFVATIHALLELYALLILSTEDGAAVCSREYREIVRLTPNVQLETSTVVRWVIGLYFGLLVFSVVVSLVWPLGAKLQAE